MSSDESNVNLPPPKKRWSSAVPLTRRDSIPSTNKPAAAAKRTPRSTKRPRTPSWKPEESTAGNANDPVSAPTPSEIEVAQTLLKLTPRNTRRHLRALHNGALKVSRPDDVPPLFGTLKEVLDTRAAVSENPNPPSVTGAEESANSSGAPPEKSINADSSQALSVSGELVMNAPYFVLPCLSQNPSQVLTERPFHQELNNLHAAAGKLTELLRMGHVPSDVLKRLKTAMPPIAFQPDFHQEIEQVRSAKRQQLMPKPPVAMFTNKPSSIVDSRNLEHSL